MKVRGLALVYLCGHSCPAATACVLLCAHVLTSACVRTCACLCLCAQAMADPEQPLQRQDVERFVRECAAVAREVAACSQRQTAEVLTRVSTYIKNEKVRGRGS